MKYPDITLGRVEAVWNKLGGEHMVQRILSGTADVAVNIRLIVVNDKVEYRGVVYHNPHTFFDDCKYLSIAQEFFDWIVLKADPVSNLPEAVGKSFELADLDYDRNIIKVLPSGYAFSESEVCARIAEMIVNQSEGQRGTLSTESNNLFYVKRIVVGVYWNTKSKKWILDASKFNGNPWGAGRRVFSRT